VNAGTYTAKPWAMLRNSSALLITLSGIAHLASLWFRELTPEALMTALIGAVYLFIGIGLYGQSRFTLFTAILLPALGSAIQLRLVPWEQLDDLQSTGIAINSFVILASAYILWRVRHHPSV
jgi:hypothetical protein